MRHMLTSNASKSVNAKQLGSHFGPFKVETASLKDTLKLCQSIFL